MPDQAHFCEGERRYTITSLMRRFHIKTKTSLQVTSHIDHCKLKRKVEEGERNDEMTRQSNSKAF